MELNIMKLIKLEKIFRGCLCN